MQLRETERPFLCSWIPLSFCVSLSSLFSSALCVGFGGACVCALVGPTPWQGAPSYTQPWDWVPEVPVAGPRLGWKVVLSSPGGRHRANPNPGHSSAS